MLPTHHFEAVCHHLVQKELGRWCVFLSPLMKMVSQVMLFGHHVNLHQRLQPIGPDVTQYVCWRHWRCTSSFPHTMILQLRRILPSCDFCSMLDKAIIGSILSTYSSNNNNLIKNIILIMFFVHKPAQFLSCCICHVHLLIWCSVLHLLYFAFAHKHQDSHNNKLDTVVKISLHVCCFYPVEKLKCQSCVICKCLSLL